MSNILIYSRNCEYCNQLLDILYREKLLGSFQQFCIDDPKNFALKSKITKVPTMILHNVNKPLVANDAFHWVSKIKNARKNFGSTKKWGPSNEEETEDDISKWNPNEMGNISDNYAHKDIDKPFNQSFVGIGSEEKNYIYTIPEKKPLNNSEQKKLIQSITNQRNDDNKKCNEIYIKKHIDAMINKK
jgi:hypothetical protein